MEHIELANQEIELLFENCECINIDMWAIESLRIETDYESFTWDRSHKILMKRHHLKYFKLVVNLDNSKYFYHTNRLIDAETIKEDGEQCIRRLINSDDLCDIYINGKCYGVPWVDEEYTGYIAGTPIKLHKNHIQVNSELTDKSGDHTLTIECDKRDKSKIKTEKSEEELGLVDEE